MSPPSPRNGSNTERQCLTTKTQGQRHTHARLKIGGYKKNGKLALVFDPEARREYLTGFSKRKKERRTFGLAMQQVKNRKARLMEREELRKAKKGALDDLPASIKGAEPYLSGTALANGKEKETMETKAKEEVYDDRFTTATFGESVLVTTSFGIPSGDEEDEEGGVLAMVREERKGGGVDKEQLQAGSVAHFKKLVAGKMPAKPKKKGGKERTKQNTSGSYMPKGKGQGEEDKKTGKKKKRGKR